MRNQHADLQRYKSELEARLAEAEREEEEERRGTRPRQQPTQEEVEKFVRLQSEKVRVDRQTHSTQCDLGGLTQHFVGFDLACSSVRQVLLGQVKIGQRWHGKWANWRNSKIKVNET